MEDLVPGGSVDAQTAVVLALLSTLALAALHLAAPRIRRLPFVPESASTSFAGGIAVAYIFLHLLPELATGNEELRELFDEETTPSPLMELGIFLVALAGFSLFYSLERLAERAGRPADRPSASGDPGRAAGGAPVFWLHVGSFAVYNAIITYTLPSTYRTGVDFAVLFTVAMGLHFLLSDRGLEEHYGERFDRWLPRLLLVGALALGWLLAAFLAPTQAVTVSLLTAFLAGSILLNVFRQELPSAGRSSLRWFLTGLVVYTVLLALVTGLAGE